MTTSSSSLAVVLCFEQQIHGRCLPILLAITYILSVVFFHVYRLAGPGLCRERKGEDDQDSAGGATSSSTGFGSFVSIASASSNIGMNCTSWKSSCMKRLEVRRNIQWAKR